METEVLVKALKKFNAQHKRYFDVILSDDTWYIVPMDSRGNYDAPLFETKDVEYLINYLSQNNKE